VKEDANGSYWFLFMSDLTSLGFDADRLREVDAAGRGAATLGRVIRVDRGMATLETV